MSALLLLLVLLGCGASTTAPPVVPPPHPPPTLTFADVSARLVRMFEDSARANGVTGAQVAVSIPGHPLLTTEFGTEVPGVPMTADKLLGTGSISKMLAAVAALRLIDQGKLSLTDTMGRWFPDTPNVAATIPLRTLLWHQSGLADYGSSPDYQGALQANFQRAWTPEELLPMIGPPAFAPGASWQASNTDRLLLSIISARTSGLPYGEFLRRELFAGAEDEVWTPGQLGSRALTPASHWGTNAAGVAMSWDQFFGPALFTMRLETYVTARELVAFARRLFDGDLLSAQGRALLLTIVADDGRVPGETGAGVGLRRFGYFGRTSYGNSGATGNSSAMYLYDPESKVIVSMNTNQAGALHRNSHFNVVPALLLEASAFATRSSIRGGQ
jgi:D-alanyl-D-alanine carboxypeptidase